jgi:DNA polymerase III subunit epsilon
MGAALGTTGLREIVLDTETSGLSPKQGHRIIEIGCVELIDKVKTGVVYHQYINPEVSIHPRALKVHGITNEFLNAYPKFSEIAEEFLAFIGNDRLVIHNARFDLGFLNNELVLSGFPKVVDRRVRCTMQIAREKHGSPATLDAVCARYKVDTSVRSNTHGALVDADVLANVYTRLCSN